jgi:pyruvate formate lyase activating enzyme
LHICPKNLVSVAGVEWEAKDLADKLLTHKTFFNTMGGGITLSGGEPLLQVDFCVELLTLLKGQVHIAIETSGYAKSDDFKKVISLCDFVYMDLKLADPAEHRAHTGVDNALIVQNARMLQASGIPHAFRTPLIPGITDTQENLTALRAIVGDSAWEQLPYNPLAGAKYAAVGKTYRL